MKKSLKKALKTIFSFFGFKISLIDRRQVPEVNRLQWLHDLNIETVIDIGANKGNATREFSEIFPNAQIFAFEPLPDCFALMRDKLKDIKNLHLFNVALSDQKGRVEMNRSSYSGSSSMLKMAELHKRLFPITAGERGVSVEVDILDDVMGNVVFEGPALMKIDVQGLEHKVLAGAKKTLEKVKVIIVETSFVELYLGQPLFEDIYKFISERGFEYKGAWDPDFCSPEDGAHLQQDAIFIRK